MFVFKIKLFQIQIVITANFLFEKVKFYEKISIFNFLKYLCQKQIMSLKKIIYSEKIR